MSEVKRKRYLGFHWWAPKVLEMIAKAKEIQATYAGRRELARMDDRMLSDIGISRAQADIEANRPFWDTTPISPPKDDDL